MLYKRREKPYEGSVSSIELDELVPPHKTTGMIETLEVFFTKSS